ncbi:hypothetical protein LCGC14_2155390, partial [marine sediment metagenome]
KKHGEATLSGDSNIANKSYDNLINSKEKLFAHGNCGKKNLIELLNHENDSVRLWAATHCLHVDAPLAIEALRALAESDSILGFSASMVIEEYNKGNI